jgi:hypothetical protein
MTRVLFLGQDPEGVDFSDPTLPAGLTIEKVRAGIVTSLANMEAQGWQADSCMLPVDDPAMRVLEQQLREVHYDCVVIGAGIRLPPKNLALFEMVINVIREAAPHAAIAFNTRPDDTAEGAARVLKSK